MISLILSILLSSLLFVIFKYFEIYKIDVLKAIVVNYYVAFTVGFIFSDTFMNPNEIFHQDWFYGAFILGGLFVGVFFVMATTTQKNGISVASIAGKMSVVIPVLFGVLMYHEKVTFLRVTGIIIALIAVYLVAYKPNNTIVKRPIMVYPFLLFIGSGIIDTTLKYVEVNFVPSEDISVFSGSLFGIAAFFGSLILFIKTIQNPASFGFKNAIAGVILGIPNYFSIYFLIKALQTKGFESSTLFTFNNIGIVFVSTIIGFLLFQEKFNAYNKVGFILAIIGIFTLAIS